MSALTVVRREVALDLVVDALRSVHLHDGYPTVWPQDPVAWLEPEGTLDAWLAIDDDDLLGHALLVRGEQVEHAAEIERAAGVPITAIGGLSRLFVVPTARGTGVAASLLDQVEAAAAERGIRLALDVVDDGGPAVRLYERRGWTRVAAGPASWVRPDGVRPRSAAYLLPVD
ncbi:GNAT family N-acetyltransferase [Cellulosimicrobium sp. PMB13]|uniref:GNAT family N-acetyltransferase n=1 Tax=Cellulosimicrobium sp. PMB13 TaxID=3120158 RepID=UPI003F4CA134